MQNFSSLERKEKKKRTKVTEKTTYWMLGQKEKLSRSMLCDHLEGCDREGGRETQEGRDMGTYVYV